MSKRYSGSRARERVAAFARGGEHMGARRASQTPRTYEVGDTVTVLATSFETNVKAIASWGDYELEGMEGKYFSSRQLKPR